MASINLCLPLKKCTILHQNYYASIKLLYFNHQTDEAEWFGEHQKKIVKYKRLLIEISQDYVKKTVAVKSKISFGVSGVRVQGLNTQLICSISQCG